MSRPRRSEFLPFSRPAIGEAEIAEVVDALRSGWLTTGPRVARFEREFAGYVGAAHCVAVSSATAGLHLSLAALGIGPGDEVIVPTMTFCSTANVVLHLGARPVLVDVGDDYNVTAGAIEAAITPRTRAVIPVHFAGLPCEMDEILEVARQRGLAVVEDAAHAVGARYRDRRVGTLGTTTVFSFYATKNMTTGEGGMIATEDPALAERLRRLALHGMSRDAWTRYTSVGSWYYEVTEAGYKCNMTDVQAALGLPQLARLEEFLARREALVSLYDAGLAGLEAILRPPRAAHSRHAWYLYVIRLRPGALAIDRAAFIEALRAANIGSSVHFIPVHTHPLYQGLGYRPGDFERAEALYAGSLSLPLYPGMSDDDAQDVIDAICTIVAGDTADGEGRSRETAAPLPPG